MDTIIRIAGTYGISADILKEFCGLLDLAGAFDGMTSEDTETAATVIAVTCRMDDPAEQLRQRVGRAHMPLQRRRGENTRLGPNRN
jgi:hypothetical protein